MTYFSTDFWEPYSRNILYKARILDKWLCIAA